MERKQETKKETHVCMYVFSILLYLCIYMCKYKYVHIFLQECLQKKVAWEGGSVPWKVQWGFRGVPCYFCHSQTPCLRGVPLQRLSLFKILKWEYGHPRPGQPRPEPLPLSRNLEAMWARCDATW